MNHEEKNNKLATILTREEPHKLEERLVNFITDYGIMTYEDNFQQVEDAIKYRAQQKDSPGVKAVLKVAAYLCSASKYKGLHVSKPLEKALQYSIMAQNVDFIKECMNGNVAKEIKSSCPDTALVVNPIKFMFKPTRNLLLDAIVTKNMEIFDLVNKLYEEKKLQKSPMKVLALAILSGSKDFSNFIEQKLQVDYTRTHEKVCESLFLNLKDSPRIMNEFIPRFKIAVDSVKGKGKMKFLERFISNVDKEMTVEQFQRLADEEDSFALVYMRVKVKKNEPLSAQDQSKCAYALFKDATSFLTFSTGYLLSEHASMAHVWSIRNQYVKHMNQHNDYSGMKIINVILNDLNNSLTPDKKLKELLENFTELAPASAQESPAITQHKKLQAK